MKYAKPLSIFASLALAGLAILYYPTDARVKERILRGYSEEIQTLSGNIEKDRAERKNLENEWRTKDNTLSGSINQKKDRIKKLDLCLSANSIDCQKAKTEAMISLIPSAFAEVAYSERIGVPERTSQTDCEISTGSHDVRDLAYFHPGTAGWKNNNPSGLTLGSKALEKSFDENGILWYVGTARPAREGSNYYGFPDLENGMRAKLLIVKRSYKNSSIASYLRVWGTDAINTHLDTSRLIASLSDEELLSLMKAQIKKESGSLADYIFSHVVKCQ